MLCEGLKTEEVKIGDLMNLRETQNVIGRIIP